MILVARVWKKGKWFVKRKERRKRRKIVKENNYYILAQPGLFWPSAVIDLSPAFYNLFLKNFVGSGKPSYPPIEDPFSYWDLTRDRISIVSSMK